MVTLGISIKPTRERRTAIVQCPIVFKPSVRPATTA